jgi:hypothetical protein
MLHSSGKTKIILTTSRKEKHREETEKELIEKNIKYDKIIMDLPHCQRIIVNDFFNSNPYPSCSAINVHRDSDDLENYIK